MLPRRHNASHAAETAAGARLDGRLRRPSCGALPTLWLRDSVVSFLLRASSWPSGLRGPGRRRPWGLARFDERAVAQLGHRLLQLGLACSSRSVRTTRPALRSACPRRAGTGCPRRRPARRLRRRCRTGRASGCRSVARHRVARRRPLGEDTARLRRVAERARAGEHVGERVARGLDGEPLARARRHRDVEVARVGGDAFDRTLSCPRSRRTITRTRVPSSSTTSGMSAAATS